MHIFKQGTIYLILIILTGLGGGCGDNGGGDDNLLFLLPGPAISISGTVTFDFVPTTEAYPHVSIKIFLGCHNYRVYAIFHYLI